jgi:hypothetical protein
MKAPMGDAVGIGDTRSGADGSGWDALSVRDYAYGDIPSEIWESWETRNAEWHSYPFESVPWLRAAADGRSPGIAMRLLVASAPRLGPVAFWPYALQRFRTGRVLPLTLCRPWTEDEREAASLVVSPALEREAYGRVAGAFLERLPRWDKMLTGLVRDPSPLLDGLIDAFGPSGTSIERTNHGFAEIRGWTSFQEFLGSLSRDWRRKYNRITKRNQESGSLRIEHLDGPRTLELRESIERRILDIYRESWKTRSADPHANLTDPGASAHFSKLLDAFARRGCLHVIFVSVDGDDAAFYVGVHFERVYCSLQTAYKEKYAGLSVGFLTQIEDFRYTIERGFLTNSLMANQDYKKHFTDTVESFSSLVVFNRSAVGAAAMLLSRARRMLERTRSRFRGRTGPSGTSSRQPPGGGA